ncbi:hypothetical protein KIL84_001974 [Mauremys mutica]|uniref:Uncharacterized protein n=1 Tax=Mauremys mutica TaxID=74926 RepID=A0A9D3XL18_9SAUR|nr:hypothetical protein KIL84_001974 [Mauremys mutica]
MWGCLDMLHSPDGDELLQPPAHQAPVVELSLPIEIGRCSPCNPSPALLLSYREIPQQGAKPFTLEQCLPSRALTICGEHTQRLHITSNAKSLIPVRCRMAASRRGFFNFLIH